MLIRKQVVTPEKNAAKGFFSFRGSIVEEQNRLTFET